MKKEITTDYGLKVIVTDDINEVKGLDDIISGPYDRTIADMQKGNCGYYIIDAEHKFVIDNEYDLDEIYGILKGKK